MPLEQTDNCAINGSTTEEGGTESTTTEEGGTESTTTDMDGSGSTTLYGSVITMMLCWMAAVNLHWWLCLTVLY